MTAPIAITEPRVEQAMRRGWVVGFAHGVLAGLALVVLGLALVMVSRACTHPEGQPAGLERPPDAWLEGEWVPVMVMPRCPECIRL